MKKLITYESADGKLFRDRAECEAHERTAGLVRWIEEQGSITQLERDELIGALAAALLRDWSLVRRSKQTKGAA